MSLLGATILTAYATLALAILALATAVLAFLAWRKQSREVRDQAAMLELQRRQLAEQEKTSAEQGRVLGLQAKELEESLAERKREAEGKRSAQASRVFLVLNLTPPDFGVTGHPAPVRITAEVVNTSDQPPYAAWILWPQGCTLAYRLALNPESLGDVLPGKRTTKIREYPAGWSGDLSDLAFRFTDAAAVKWMRRPGGVLTEQP